MAKHQKKFGKEKQPTVTIKSGGVGDTVEKIIKATKVDKVIQLFVDGKDCGCEERKEKLNNILPYRFKARCLTEEEYKQWAEFKAVRTLKLTDSQVKFVCELFATVFNRQVFYPCPGCSPKPIISMIDRLDQVYDIYAEDLNKG